MLESGEMVLDERQLPARQGRIAFTYLVLNRERPVPRDELVRAVWADDSPEAWESSLSALLSRATAAAEP